MDLLQLGHLGLVEAKGRSAPWAEGAATELPKETVGLEIRLLLRPLTLSAPHFVMRMCPRYLGTLPD